MQHVINILMLVVPVLYVTLQTLVLRQWTGFHQRLALLPLAGWAVWGAVLGYRVLQGEAVRPALPGARRRPRRPRSPLICGSQQRTRLLPQPAYKRPPLTCCTICGERGE